jgi:hypothetical protein
MRCVTLLATIVLIDVLTVIQTPQAAQKVLEYRFTIDYYNFSGTAFRSKQRIVGEYQKNADGTVQWENVTSATATTIDGTFGDAEPQAFMNGFRYDPKANSMLPGFFKGFPLEATPQRNLVWDTRMFEHFAQQLSKVSMSGAIYHLPSSRVPLAETGSFKNTDIELSRRSVVDEKGQHLTILHYDAFFNTFELDLPRGMKMVGRSDYWGDMWMLPTNEIEHATLFEEVIGEVHMPNTAPPQMVNVLRRGTFERK